LNNKWKYLLLSSVIALIIIGLSYTMVIGSEFRDQALMDAFLIQLIPEKCRVVETSQGVDASVEFIRDELGNIVDRTYVKLVLENVYAGANVTFRIAAKNISSIPLSVDYYTLYINSRNYSLEDSIYFSGSVKIFRDNSEYYDLIGTFKDVSISELANNLTNMMKYRKIDITEEIQIELDQRFGDSGQLFTNNEALSYTLVPRFVQYFPEDKK
jgi:hypothetical protein